MARFHYSSVRAAFLLCILFALTLGASRSASQGEGFQSINCGGEAYIDLNTTLPWEQDPFNKESNELLYGRVGKVSSNFENNTNALRTLRYFPSDIRNRKFCYSLQVSNGSTYLLRASFLYGNYDKLNQPPIFALIINYDTWTNVSTSSSTTPVMNEITFISKDHILNICLAPLLSTNHTPFISTIELRLLESTMYMSAEAEYPTAFDDNYGLMLWRRIDYGARTKTVTRYPDDPYDRIWEADTTKPRVSRNTIQVGKYYGDDMSMPPAEVMATAITSQDPEGLLSFTYEGYGGVGGFRMEMHFQEVDEKLRGHSPRDFAVQFPNAGVVLTNLTQLINSAGITPTLDGPVSRILDQQLNLPLPLSITFFPLPTSPRPPLLNAIELFRWTPSPLSPIGTLQGDVEAIMVIQTHFMLWGYGQGDPCMPNGSEWIWIACNEDSPPRIKEINLANLNLTGDIPPSINNLGGLQRVNLSYNMLTGSIPNVSSLPYLEYLDVSYNNLCGSLPKNLVNIVKYTGNNWLCDECHCNSSMDSNSLVLSKKKGTKKYVIAIFIMGALYIMLMLILLGFYKRRHIRTKKEMAKSTTTNKKGFDDVHHLPSITKMFTYNDISTATLNFTTVLGQGGFGKVYHGLLPTGEAIAVKLLADASRQGLKEFYNEVAILSRVSHKNVVSLLGYCVENTCMLIYEYIANGNLKDLLYGDVESTNKPLPWITRLQVALDASQGLDYLHTGCDPAIIHRDVKSSNILLSDKMQAKVADFGLSRLKEGESTISHVSTANVVGTAGYLDPAYNATNQLTDKSDVYSFGIVLLELICGRAPIDMFTIPPHIVDWATSSIMQGKVADIVDPTLANGYKVNSMWRVVDLAYGCVQSDRVKRPKMSQVSQMLRIAFDIEINESSPYTSTDVSGSSSTSDEKFPSLQYIKNTPTMLEPR